MIRALAFVACNAVALLPANANESRCFERDHLTAFLTHEYQMQLMSWGMTADGDMIELFWADSGHFAAVTTTPAGCVSVTMPEHLELAASIPYYRRNAPMIGNLSAQLRAMGFSQVTDEWVDGLFREGFLLEP